MLKAILYPSYIVFVELNEKQKEYLKRTFTLPIPNFQKVKYIHLNFLKRKIESAESEEEKKKLESRLQRFTNWDGTISFFNEKRSLLPIGFLPYISSDLKILNDLRNNIISVSASGVKLRGIQIREYQARAIRKILYERNGFINLAVNAGKTLIIVLASALLRRNRVLIIVHRKEIFDVILSKFESYLGFTDIGKISSEEIVLKDITIAMLQTLRNRLSSDRNVLKWFRSVNVLFIDEAHHCSSATYKSILRQSRARIRIGFSGTLPEEGTLERFEVEQFIGPILEKVDSFDLIRSDISVMPEIKIVQCKGRDAETYEESIRENIIFNEDLNSKIVQIVLENKDKKVIVITDYILHGRIISNALTNLKVRNQFLYGEILDRQKYLKEFETGKLNVVVATNIFDEGIDVPDINVLVLGFPRKSYRQVIQRIGRGMRKGAEKEVLYVYDFENSEDRYQMQHLKKRIEYYEDENFVYTFSEIEVQKKVLNAVLKEIEVQSESSDQVIQEGFRELEEQRSDLLQHKT